MFRALILLILVLAGCGGGTAPNPCANTACPDPHPPGWTAREAHGAASLRDTSCVGCHSQGDGVLCVACHRVGGNGGSTHQTSWLSTVSAASLAANGTAPIGGGIQVHCHACHP